MEMIIKKIITLEEWFIQVSIFHYQLQH